MQKKVGLTHFFGNYPPMTRASFKPRKPIVYVGTLGQEWHGKSTLTTAIINVQALHGLAVRDQGHVNESAPEERARGLIVNTVLLDYETEKRCYAHTDCPSHADYTKNLITGGAQMDGAILVVDATEGPTSETKEQVRLARKVGVQAMVVFINKQDLVEDMEESRLVETQVRQLLTNCGFCGDDTPVIFGSASNVVDHIQMTRRAGRGENEWVDKIHDLLQALDEHIPQSQRNLDKPFLMTVEEILAASDQASLVKGHIEAGKVKTGDAVEIVGIKPSRETTAGTLEIFDRTLAEGSAGDYLGLRLPAIAKQSLQPGMVLARPNSIKPCSRFEAELYVIPKEEGGRHTSIFTGYRPMFYLHYTDIPGHITGFIAKDGSDAEMVMAGRCITMRAELLYPIALKPGMPMVLRESGRTIAAAVVTKILG